MDCMSCGKTLTPGSGFCTACGAAVKGVAPATPPSVVDTPAAPAGRRRGGRVLLLTAVAAIVLAGGGITAFALLSAVRGDAGGAETPEDLVAAFEEAAATNDLAGIFVLLPPGERRPLARLFNEVVDRGRDEALWPAEGSPLDGVTITFDGFDPDIDEIDDGLARVELGEFQLSLAFGEPIRELAAQAGYMLQDVDLQVPAGWERYDWQTNETTEVDGFVMAVRRDDRWYLSGLYTLAQTLVEAFDLDEVDMSTVPDSPPAADTPEDALIEYIESLADLDADTIIAGITGVTNVLAAYEDAVDDAVRMLEDELRKDDISRIDVDVDTLEVTTTEVEGGLLDVAIDEFDIEFAAGDTTFRLEFDSRCLDVEESRYSDTPLRDEACLPDAFTELSGIDSWSVRMRPVEDGYAIDPLETIAATLEDIISQGDSSALLRALGLTPLAPDMTEVAVGEVTEVTTSPAGTWVGAFEAEAGQSYNVVNGSEHWSRTTLIAPDGDLPQKLGPNMWHATTTGTHTVSLELSEWDRSRVDVSVRTVQVVDHAAEADIDVMLAPGELRGFRIEPPERGLLIDGQTHHMVTPEGQRSFCGDAEDPCTDTVIIYVGGRFDQDRVHVRLSSPPTYGFTSGGLTASGRVTDSTDRVVFLAQLPADARYTLHVVPDPDFDPRLIITSPDALTGTIDSGYAGDIETVRVSGHPEGIWRFEVRGWSGSTGSFTLRLVPDGETA